MSQCGTLVTIDELMLTHHCHLKHPLFFKKEVNKCQLLRAGCHHPGTLSASLIRGLERAWERGTLGPGYLSHRKQFPALLGPAKLVAFRPAVACWVFDRFHVGFPHRLDREISCRPKGRKSAITSTPPPLFCPPAWTEPSLPAIARSLKPWTEA